MTTRTRGALGLALTVLLAALATLAPAPAGAEEPAPPTGLTWRISTGAFTSSSLSPAHDTTAPATKGAEAFSFPEATAVSYDPATGAASATFPGAVVLGNTVQGNYRIKIDTPILTLDGEGDGALSALVSYALFQEGQHVWSTPVRATVADLTLAPDSVSDTGSSVSFTVTPDFVLRTDLADNPNGWRQFPQPFLDALAPAVPSLLGHFRETGAGSDGTKAPAPLTVSFPYSATADGLTWKMSTGAWTSSSLSPAHATTAPAEKTEAGFSFPETSSVGWDPDTGRARVAFPGAYDLGNTVQGNYRIRVADPVVSLDGDGTGQVDATVSYALFQAGQHVWSEPVSATVATFTLPEGQPVQVGRNVSFTVTPDFVLRTDLADNPNGWRQFPQPFLDALAPAVPSLLGHFRETGAGSDGAKAPAPLTVSFTHAPATLTLGDLEQSYDGTPRPVTVTTDPAGLEVEVTYDGSTQVPTTPGSYAVVATIAEGELAYGEPATGTLVVAKGAQAITFPELGDRYLGDGTVALEATASSGLPVTYSATGACSVDGDVLALEEEGACTVTAAQPGDDLWEAAAPVSRTFTVRGDAEAFVRRLYEVELGRAADAGGVAFWVGVLEDGATTLDVADLLGVTAEGRARLVTETYQRALGRPADASGKAYWSQRLARGLTAEDLLATLLASPEALGQAGPGSVDAAELLYEVHLGRSGDQAGVHHWAARLEAATTAGARRQLALAFGRTSEAGTVGVRRAVTRACEGTVAVPSIVPTTWLATGRHPLRTAGAALAAICPSGTPA